MNTNSEVSWRESLSSSQAVVLTGESLECVDIRGLVQSATARISIHADALARTRESREFLERAIAGKVIYGINTGFGPMASHLISDSQLLTLQENLIRSHAVGMGESIPEEYVLAAMVIRLNTLAKGHSGVTEQLLRQLEYFINNRIVPVVPEHGAVGTSGDLVQLAHIALALMGEGKVVQRGSLYRTAELLEKQGVRPLQLGMKEGLALINGTAMMTGIAALFVEEVERLVSLSLRTSALALELVDAYGDGIDERLHELRPHQGQKLVARMLRNLLADSKCLRTRKALNGLAGFSEDVKVLAEPVQEVYSLRCVPQIVGAVCDALQTARRIVEVEMNAVTDNPVVDAASARVLHGGNFHGDYVAYAVDQLKMAVVKLTMLSERRISYFLGPSRSRFPPFMNLGKPPLTLGLQGLQFVATSTTAQSQTLAFPQYVHSISTNGDNQDVVSMGTDAALLAMKVARNASTVLAIEAVTLAQGVDFLGSERQLSAESRRLFQWVREVIGTVREDRELISELELLQARVRHDEWPRLPILEQMV